MFSKIERTGKIEHTGCCCFDEKPLLIESCYRREYLLCLIFQMCIKKIVTNEIERKGLEADLIKSSLKYVQVHPTKYGLTIK